MALLPEETRKVYLHMGVEQVSAVGELLGGVPELTQRTHQLQAALNSLTPNGETTVRELLTTLDALRTKLTTVDTRFQATKVDTIELNPKEWSDRITQYDYFRGQLARTLAVPFDPPSEADAGGGLRWTREP